MIYDNIYLDLTISRIQNIRCSVGDSNSRIVNINLTNNGKIYTMDSNVKLYLKAQRYNGTFVYLSENAAYLYKKSSSVVCVKIIDKLTAIHGICCCELELINKTTDEIISSCNFNLVIENSPILNTSIAATNEFQAMNQILSYFGGLDEKTDTLTIDFTGDIEQSKQYMEQSKAYSESSKNYYDKIKNVSGSGQSDIVYSSKQPSSQTIEGLWIKPY